jgi:hypothetical protein
MKTRGLNSIALATLSLITLALLLLGYNTFAIAETGSSVAQTGASETNGETFDFADLNGWEFEFTSGAGGWRTSVEIASDGTFSGGFHDSEMGSTGEDYPNGTVYVSNFSGKFVSMKKIGDYEYAIQCETLTQEGEKGDVEIIDGIKYITSTPYGFDDADEFRLYLPGKKVSELPEDYLEWVRFAIEDGDELDFYGLYNVGGKQGFSSYSEAMNEADHSKTSTPSETMLTFDSELFEQVSHNKYTLNGIFFVTLEAGPLAKTVLDEESVLERIRELEGEKLRELRASESEEISARLTFPSWLVYYEKGENEDAQFCVDLYFQSNTTEYRVHIEVDHDAAPEYEDAYGVVLDTVKVQGAYRSETSTPSKTTLTFDSEGFEQVSHNMYTLNGIFFVTLETWPLTETVLDEESVLERIRELEGEKLLEPKASESEEISARLSFPSWLVYYDKGENEDVRFCVDLYFQSNTTEYRVHIEVDHDAAPEYEDAYGLVLGTVELQDD